jgi:hypothetical protein
VPPWSLKYSIVPALCRQAVYCCSTLHCTALHCTDQHRHLFVLVFPSSYVDRLPPSSPPRKPCSRAGHDTETPTGLGTHKSARACCVSRLNLFLASAYLASVTSACTCSIPCTSWPCTEWSSPRVTDLAEFMTLAMPACLVPEWLRARQTPTNRRCSQASSHRRGDRPERCMRFFRPHQPSPSGHYGVTAVNHSSKHFRRQVQSRLSAPIATTGTHDSRTACVRATPVTIPANHLSATQASRRLNKHSNNRQPQHSRTHHA